MSDSRGGRIEGKLWNCVKENLLKSELLGKGL